MNRPGIIMFGSGISILGALVALIAMGFQVNDGNYEFGYIAASALIALLFFATAGTFYVEGRNNQITSAAIIAINIAVILISQLVGKWADSWLYIVMFICAAIAAVIVCTKDAKKWFTAVRV